PVGGEHGADGPARPPQPRASRWRRGAGVRRRPRFRRPRHRAGHGPGAGGGDAAAARARGARAVRRRGLEARGDRRGAGDGGRQLEGATASRARPAARATGGTRMNHDNEHGGTPMDDGTMDDGTIDATLRLQLRGLRRDIPPATDLWPGIAARIATPPAASRRPRTQRYAPWALAASLVLALGVAWKMQPRPVPAGTVPSAEAR